MEYSEVFNPDELVSDSEINTERKMLDDGDTIELNQIELNKDKPTLEIPAYGLKTLKKTIGDGGVKESGSLLGNDADKDKRIDGEG